MKNTELFEKYKTYGLNGMSDSEILQLVLSFASVKDTEKVSERLISEYGSLNAVLNADINHLIGSDVNEKTACL
ncbi:MAG: hypothetical protein ACI4PX_06945, partial [Ruminococcus sp.]